MAGKPAARIGDMHICPKAQPGPVPHVGGPIVQGSGNVIIGGSPAARVGDMAVCIGPPDKASSGSATVFINGKAATRLGDSSGHGGKIVMGCPTVYIGDSSSKAEGSVAVVNTKKTTGSEGHLPKPPATKEEAIQRLNQAAVKIHECRETQQPLPRSPFATEDKMRIVQNDKPERFIARIVKTRYATDEGTIGYLPEGATTSTYWTTTFTQIEFADTDAQLIAQALGLDYDPKSDYTLLLINQEQAFEEGDMVSFIPTYDNLGGFAEKEIAEDFEGQEHLIAPCMTEEYSQGYERIITIAAELKLNLNDKRQFNKAAKNLGFDEDMRHILRVRHQMNNTLGANEQFLGNGMTKDNTATNLVTPFGEPKTGQAYGPIETFTYDKNPKTLGVLERAGIVTRIPLKSV